MQRPVRGDWGVVIANGAIHSIEIILRSLLDPGEPVLCEEFTFSQVLDGLLFPIGYEPIGLSMDDEGTCACTALCRLLFASASCCSCDCLVCSEMQNTTYGRPI